MRFVVEKSPNLHVLNRTSALRVFFYLYCLPFFTTVTIGYKSGLMSSLSVPYIPPPLGKKPTRIYPKNALI